MKAELDEFHTIVSNSEFEEISDANVIEVVQKYFKHVMKEMKSMRSPPLNSLILSFNMYSYKANVYEKFDDFWADLEKLVYGNISNLSNEALVNIVYYFCKFQKANKAFWARFDSKLDSHISVINN